jgi:hypothetical protein
MGELGGGGIIIFPDNFAWIIFAPEGRGFSGGVNFVCAPENSSSGGASGRASEGLF